MSINAKDYRVPTKLIAAAKEAIEKAVETKGLRLIVKANSLDIAGPCVAEFILQELMGVVVDMSVSELNQGDWWNRGFPTTAQRASSNTTHHSELLRLSSACASDVLRRLT